MKQLILFWLCVLTAFPIRAEVERDVGNFVFRISSGGGVEILFDSGAAHVAFDALAHDLAGPLFCESWKDLFSDHYLCRVEFDDAVNLNDSPAPPNPALKQLLFTKRDLLLSLADVSERTANGSGTQLEIRIKDQSAKNLLTALSLRIPERGETLIRGPMTCAIHQFRISGRGGFSRPHPALACDILLLLKNPAVDPLY